MIKAPYTRFGKTARSLLAAVLMSLMPLAEVPAQFKTSPLVRNFPANEYRASTENWYVVRHTNGLIYVANSNGILEYDGKTWRLIKIKDGGSTRSLFSDPLSGRLYIGAQGDFGFLAPDKFGKMEYTSLKEILPQTERQFSEIWNVFNHNGYIYFHNDFVIFKYDGKKQIDLIKPQDKNEGFYCCYLANNIIYVHEPTIGFCRLNGSKTELLPGCETFKNDHIYSVEKFDDRRVIFRTKSKGIYLYDGQKPVPFEGPVSKKLHEKKTIHIRKLKNGDFAFATLLDGVIITDPKGNLKAHITESTGLQNNVVMSVADDEEGNLWMATIKGVSVSRYPNPLTYLSEKDGLTTGIASMSIWKDKIFIGTLDGLYLTDARNPSQSLKKVPDVTGIIQSIRTVGDDVWVMSYAGVYLSRNGTPFRKITEGAVTGFAPSRIHPGTYYLGTWKGLYALREIAGGSFEKIGPLTGIEMEIRALEEDAEGFLWAQVLRQGLAKIDFRKEINNHAPMVLFTEKSGLPDKAVVRPTWIQNRLLFTTLSGFYEYDGKNNTFRREKMLNTFLPLSDKKLLEAFATPEGNIWLNLRKNEFEHEIGILRKMPDGTFHYSADPFAVLGDGSQLYGLQNDSEGKTWIVTAEALVGYDPKVTVNYSLPFHPVLRTIHNSEGQEAFSGLTFRPAAEPLTINYDDSRNLRFTVGTDRLENADLLRYQYLLEPFDTDWSAPTKDHYFTYTNLYEGKYTLRVRAVNAAGIRSNELRYEIKISPPWYRHWLAYGAYVLMAVLALRLFYKLKTRRLKNDRLILEARVNERTDALNKQKLALEASHAEIYAQKFELENQNKLLDTYSKQINRQKGDLEKAFEIISSKNLETEAANAQISAQNALVNAKNTELERTMAELAQAGEEARALNDQLSIVNKELTEQKGELINAFEEINTKNEQLEKQALEIHRANQLLGEQNTALLTNQEELKRTLEHLQEAQAHIIMSEKMGVLGTMMAGVAHEINTPIGAIKAAAENVNANLPPLIAKLPEFFAKLNPQYLELFFKLVDVAMKAEPVGSVAEERQIRKNVSLALEAMRVDKADTLARTLSKVGVYKQLNDFDILFKHPNAVEIIETAGSLGKLRLNTDNILTAVGKTQKIIFALRSFSHQNPSVEMVPAKIEAQIPIALTLYHNTLKQGIEVITDFQPDLPEIYCYPDELDQVWINLITNSAHAMNNKGILKIKIYTDENYLRVSFTDSGKGIPSEVLPRIFEPFYTTKAQGEGTGLGLHICKQIIDKHQGLIQVESVPGNTTFIVSLPLRISIAQGIRAPKS